MLALKKLLWHMEPTTIKMGLIYSAFLYASAVPMPPSRPPGIVLDSKFLGARSLPLMLGSGKERGAKCHALVLLQTTPAAFSIHCRVE